jgi:hypothetical protein
MLRNVRMRYCVARQAGHSSLHSLGFALFKQRPPSVRKQIDDENRLLLDFKKKLHEGIEAGLSHPDHENEMAGQISRGSPLR